MLRLQAHTIIDPDSEVHFAVHRLSDAAITQPHCHDFFEIFLITEGSVTHLINGEKVPIAEGALVFMRPDDVHSYRKHPEQACSLANLAFTDSTMRALLAYLEADEVARELMRLPQPSTVQLSYGDKTRVESQFQALYKIPAQDKHALRTAVRALLAELLSAHFLPRSTAETSEMPTWLSGLCTLMQQPEYFIEGRSALLRLACRSEEHIGRAFKAYIGVTPSQFINDLRLDYAANLLLHTDRAIVDIVSESGFGNVSHFYHRFQTRWHESPHQYRQRHRKNPIP